MNQAIPEAVQYVVVGAGVHGLSAAWHLALELKARGRGRGDARTAGGCHTNRVTAH